MEAVKKLKDIIGKVTKSIEASVDAKIMKALGLEAVNKIRIRTRLGYGVRKTGDRRERLSSMQPHSPEYKEYRKTHRDELSNETRPTKQNLTLHGDMLEDMWVDAKDNEVTIFFSKQENQDKAEAQTKAGRKFLDLSDLELKQMQRIFENNLENHLRKVREEK